MSLLTVCLYHTCSKRSRACAGLLLTLAGLGEGHSVSSGLSHDDLFAVPFD